MMASRPRLCWMDPTSWPMSTDRLSGHVSTHKVDGVEDAIAARGACAVFPPTYSPDLNPIEPLFARLKSFLRKMKDSLPRSQLWSPAACSINPLTSGGGRPFGFAEYPHLSRIRSISVRGNPGFILLRFNLFGSLAARDLKNEIVTRSVGQNSKTPRLRRPARAARDLLRPHIYETGWPRGVPVRRPPHRRARA